MRGCKKNVEKKGWKKMLNFVEIIEILREVWYNNKKRTNKI